MDARPHRSADILRPCAKTHHLANRRFQNAAHRALPARMRRRALGGVERNDHLEIMALSPEARSVLPPIATISAMRKLTS